MLLFSWQVDIEMKSRRTRRKDGLELPAYAAGLANSNVGPTGPGLLEPTQIMTPTIVASNSSSSISKTRNDRSTVGEEISHLTGNERKIANEENCDSNMVLPSKASVSNDDLHMSSSDIDSNQVTLVEYISKFCIEIVLEYNDFHTIIFCLFRYRPTSQT